MGYEVIDIGGSDYVCFMTQSNSILYLPLILHFLKFLKNFCISYVPEVQNTAYSFPSLGLRLVEHLIIMVIMLSSVPPQGSLRMGFTRGSIIKQAPLEESESPPSSLTFRLMLILFW